MKTPLDAQTYLSIPDLVELFRFRNEKAARFWVTQQGLRKYRRGRNVLLKRVEAEAALGVRETRDLVLVRKA